MQRKPRKKKNLKKKADLSFAEETSFGVSPWKHIENGFQEIIDLLDEAARNTSISRWALCYLCNHKWKAIVPVDLKTEHVECPICHEHTGFFADSYDDGADDSGSLL